MGYQEGNPFAFLEEFWRTEMRESERGRCFVSFVVFSVLVVTVFGFGGEIAAQEPDNRPVWVRVPFCTTKSVWTGEYEVVDYRTIEIPFLDYREVLVPGTGIWRIEFKKAPYTAYRCKVRWVNKIVSVAHSRWEPVRRFIRKVKTWFESTWYGKLIKKIRVTLQPVTRWVKRTVWNRVTRRVREVFMEPYTAYRDIPVPVWIAPRTIRVPFTNYREKKIPIREKVMIEIPAGGLEWHWKLVNGKDVPFRVLQLMFGRLHPCDPLEDRLGEIYEIWRQFKANFVAYSHDPWYREELELFFGGLPAEDDYWEAETATLSNGFGGGQTPWEDYTADGLSAAQYFGIGELAKDWEWANDGEYLWAHFNLCGELSVMGVVGDTIPHGLDLFNRLDFDTLQTAVFNEGKKDERKIPLHTGADILKNNVSTWDTHVAEFFEAYGWEAETHTGDAAGDDLSEELEAGRGVVALVELSTTTGFLAPDGGTAHWVSVLQVLHTQNGEDIVRVYNPFHNREEYYEWEYFHNCWTQTPGNNSVCLRVVGWEEE